LLLDRDGGQGGGEREVGEHMVKEGRGHGWREKDGRGLDEEGVGARWGEGGGVRDSQEEVKSRATFSADGGGRERGVTHVSAGPSILRLNDVSGASAIGGVKTKELEVGAGKGDVRTVRGGGGGGGISGRGGGGGGRLRDSQEEVKSRATF